LRQGPLRLRLCRERRPALTQPLVRNAAGKLEPATWEHALRVAAGQAEGRFATHAAARPSASSAPTAPPTKRITCCRSLRARCFTPTTSTTSAAPTTQPLPALSPEQQERRPACATSLRLRHPARRRQSHGRASAAGLAAAHQRAPEPRAALHRQFQSPSSWTGRPRPRRNFRLTATRISPLFSIRATSDFSKSLAEESLVVLFGEEFRGDAVENLVAWGLKRGNVRFACLGDHSPTPAAQPTWASSPICCPAMFRSPLPAHLPSIPILPATPGKRCRRCSKRLRKGELGRLLVVGANPVAPSWIPPRSKNTFVIVQDLFLTETAALADVVLPAASLYEKSGTVTNTYGDVQLVKKAADRAGVKPDFEILVRLAGAMGVDVKTLVPFGKRGVTGRSGPVARRAGRRGRSPRRVAGGQQPGVEAQPLRSARCAGRDRAAGSRLQAWTGSIFLAATMCIPNRALCRSLR
jgi:NADH-quinone oxidoreductase subunit G